MEIPMRKTIFAFAAAAALMAPLPASAQLFFNNDPAAGDGAEAAAVPAYGQNAGQAFGFAPRIDVAPACRTVRERFVTPRGHVVTKTHRSCD
jgi:hypothetical protein